MASKSFKASRSNLSTDSEMTESQNGRPPLPPQSHVTFARRTSSGRYVNYSRDDLDSELGNGDFLDYTVQIPLTPDNQPSNPVTQKVEEQYVSSSLFTGGFNSMTRAHLMDKVIDSDASHPQMAGAKGSSCSVPGCDGKAMSDERGDDILPCEYDFKICRDCYFDVLKTGEGVCPGCKEQYNAADLDEAMEKWPSLPQLPPPPSGVSKVERRMSLMKSNKSMLMRSQTADFDHNRWLFETKGTYGYGNAIWPKEGGYDDEKNERTVESSDLVSKPWRPLTRKLKIPAAIISPYRYISTNLIFVFSYMIAVI